MCILCVGSVDAKRAVTSSGAASYKRLLQKIFFVVCAEQCRTAQNSALKEEERTSFSASTPI
jgi:uncharacterized protein (DUF1501 family)